MTGRFKWWGTEACQKVFHQSKWSTQVRAVCAGGRRHSQHTHSVGIETIHVFEATEQMLLPGPSCSLPAASDSNDTQALALHTHKHTHTHSYNNSHNYHISSLWLSRFMRFSLSVFVCAGQGHVYCLEECPVFGDVKSSQQWSESLSLSHTHTHSLLLDGPEIPLWAPRGQTRGF